MSIVCKMFVRDNLYLFDYGKKTNLYNGRRSKTTWTGHRMKHYWKNVDNERKKSRNRQQKKRLEDLEKDILQEYFGVISNKNS